MDDFLGEDFNEKRKALEGTNFEEQEPDRTSIFSLCTTHQPLPVLSPQRRNKSKTNTQGL